MELQQRDSILTFKMDNPSPKQYGHEDFKWSAPWATSTFGHNDMGHIFWPLFYQLRVGQTRKLLQEILSNKGEGNWSRAGMEQKSLVMHAANNFLHHIYP